MDVCVPVEALATKHCPRCGGDFPLATGFHVNRSAPSGHQGWCKTCMCRVTAAYQKIRQAAQRLQRKQARAAFADIANRLVPR